MKIREIFSEEEEEEGEDCGGEAGLDEALRGGALGHGGGDEWVEEEEEDDEEELWVAWEREDRGGEARLDEALRGGALGHGGEASGHGGSGEAGVEDELEDDDWDEARRDEDLRGGASRRGEASGSGRGGGGWLDFTQRKLVAVGARIALYPTLAYNLARNKIQTEFHWWDRIDEFVLLGAVPFCYHVPRLNEQGVRGVVTLNEPFETFVPKKVYQDHGIRHLHIPTRDYAFAPSQENICEALDFIHSNALQGNSTYVHCKAGRGRSTTVVLCYLIRYKKMTPKAAWAHIKSIRSRVCLTKSQWVAVTKFNDLNLVRDLEFQSLLATDGRSMVVGADSDLEGCNNDAGKDTGSAEVVACCKPNPRKIQPEP